MFKDLFPPGLFPNQKHNVVPDRGFKGVESDYPATTVMMPKTASSWIEKANALGAHYFATGLIKK